MEPIPWVSRAPAERGEQGAEKGAEDLAGERPIVGTAVAKRVGQREDPLADGHFGQDAIDEVCGAVGHAPAAARGAEATPLAGEGHQAIVAAGIAVEPQKAVGQDPAAKVGAKLLLDEAGYGLILLAGAHEERLELLADDAVQAGLFRPVSFVGRCAAGREEARGRGVGGVRAGHLRRALREACRGVGPCGERRGLVGSS